MPTSDVDRVRVGKRDGGWAYPRLKSLSTPAFEPAGRVFASLGRAERAGTFGRSGCVRARDCHPVRMCLLRRSR